jgi:hypothetical protein
MRKQAEKDGRLRDPVASLFPLNIGRSWDFAERRRNAERNGGYPSLTQNQTEATPCRFESGHPHQ